MPEDRLYRSMLLDFYGELLTPRQRECYELHFNDDLSLSEVAEQCGISRQGAWDNIRRASDTMEELEEKTGLIRRIMETDHALHRLAKLLDRLSDLSDNNGKSSVTAGILQEAREEVRALLREED